MAKGKTNQKYTPEFKKLVVETMHTEHLRYVETTARFHIWHKRIQDWERIYLAEGPEGLSVERRGQRRYGYRRVTRPFAIEAYLLTTRQFNA